MGKDASIPTISRVTPDGTLVEVLYDAEAGKTALAVYTPDGLVSIEPHFDTDTGERLVPYGATNNLLSSGCVLLPSAVGERLDKPSLLALLRAFIHRYVDLSPLFEDIAAHYVLLSWVHDAFNEVPYLRLQGAFGTGKTRALLVVGSLCYKPFFASGASTVSPIFHVLDAFGATLVLDEADLRFSDATADLTKILNNGSMKGLPVLRTMANRHRELNPQAFKVFGPKLVAMRKGFNDEGLESRFITERSDGRPLREDIAISLPDSMNVEARELRNHLLAWRFSARHSVMIDPTQTAEALSPRGNQMALPLLALVDDAGLREQIAGVLMAEEARAAAIRAISPEAMMADAIVRSFDADKTPFVPLAKATAACNEAIESHGGEPLSVKSAGWLVRARLGLQTRKTGGVYVIPQTEQAKARDAAARMGVALEKRTSAIADQARTGSARSAEKYALAA